MSNREGVSSRCREHHNQHCAIHRGRGVRGFVHSYLEAQNSDLVRSIFKKNHNQNKRASDRKGIIQLLLISRAIVVVVLGLYGGLASSHHH